MPGVCSLPLPIPVAQLSGRTDVQQVRPRSVLYIWTAAGTARPTTAFRPGQRNQSCLPPPTPLPTLQLGAYARLFSLWRTLFVRIRTDVNVGSELRSLLRRQCLQESLQTAFSTEKIKARRLGVPTSKTQCGLSTLTRPQFQYCGVRRSQTTSHITSRTVFLYSNLYSPHKTLLMSSPDSPDGAPKDPNIEVTGHD